MVSTSTASQAVSNNNWAREKRLFIRAFIIPNNIVGKLDAGRRFNTMFRHFVPANDVVLDNHVAGGRGAVPSLGEVDAAFKKLWLAGDSEAAERGVRFIAAPGIQIRHAIVADDVAFADREDGAESHSGKLIGFDDDVFRL